MESSLHARRAAWLALLAAPLFCHSASAQDGVRKGDSDWTIFVPFLDAGTNNFEGGTSIKLDDSWGIGFGFDYFLSDSLSVGGTFTYSEPDYEVNLHRQFGTFNLLKGEMEQWGFMGNITYQFGDGKLRPYVMGQAGWQYVDSNIADGPPTTGGCWWDPWWGYTCTVWQDTKTETDFAYGVGVGLRVSLSPGLFLDVGAVENWVDWGHSSGSSDYLVYKIGLGFHH